jgi:hypothetical protein
VNRHLIHVAIVILASSNQLKQFAEQLQVVVMLLKHAQEQAQLAPLMESNLILMYAELAQEFAI